MRCTLLFVILMAVALDPIVAQDRDNAWVARRVAEIKESDTSAWRKITWAESLLEAEKSARDQGRPLFLFTMDGNLDTGRC